MIIAQYMDVILREFTEADVPKKVEWINNPENNQYLHYDLPLRVDRTIEWYRKKDNSRRLDCVIEYNQIPVGLIGLLQIDKDNQKAEYYITIGENRFKHKGIATKATKAILEYAFEKLNLHKVYLTVDARNENAIHLYEKVGFKQEGYFVDDLFHPVNKEFLDRCRYAICRNGGVTLYYIIENPSHRKSLPERIPKLLFIQKMGCHKDNTLWIQREDLIPFSFGGNKARKAQLFFEQIDRGDYDCVVTYGSSSSNHCRIIANMAAARKLPCYIISPEEASEETYNSDLMRIFGAEFTICPVQEVHDTIEEKLADLRKQGFSPYFIAGGGHGNIGTQAYVDCYEEIRDYEAQNNIHFDYIFHASGTGTTQAGLVCGQLINRDDRKIVGISIARRLPRGRDVVLESIREYLIEQNVTVSENAIEDATVFVDDYVGDGYGADSQNVDDVIRTVMIQYGIPLDSTYTGKAFAGMLDYVKKNSIENKNILFIHTGGTPLFFDDMNRMKNQ